MPPFTANGCGRTGRLSPVAADSLALAAEPDIVKPLIPDRYRVRLVVALLSGSTLFVSARAASPELQVEARFPRSPTGTTHLAEALTFRIGSARPLHLSGGVQPIPGPTLRLSPSHFLLLGWSSPGGGLQSTHALVVGTHRDVVVLIDQFIATTDRLSSGLLLRVGANDTFRLGVPKPPDGAIPGDNLWSLVHQRSRRSPLHIADIRRLRFEAAGEQAGDVFYAPPAQSARRPAEVTWWTVSSAGISSSERGTH